MLNNIVEFEQGGGNYSERVLNEDGTKRMMAAVYYQSPAGHGREVRKKGVEVVHQCHPSGEDEARSGGGRGLVGRAVDAVAHGERGAIDAVSGMARNVERLI